MTIEQINQDAVRTLKLNGRLDTLTAPQLDAEVGKLDGDLWRSDGTGAGFCRGGVHFLGRPARASESAEVHECRAWRHEADSCVSGGM